MNTQHFKRGGFAEIGIVAGRLFDVASLTPGIKESLRASMADGQMAIDARRAPAQSSGNPFGSRPIAITANATQGNREICLAASMDNYISRPIRIAD